MITKQELGEILKTEVNSASLTYENHNRDNGFLYSDIDDVVKALNDRYSDLEPVGICRDVPFPCNAIANANSVGFVYKVDGETYWCHFTEMLWFSLLSDVYGRKEADLIIYPEDKPIYELIDKFNPLMSKISSLDNSFSNPYDDSEWDGE